LPSACRPNLVPRRGARHRAGCADHRNRRQRERRSGRVVHAAVIRAVFAGEERGAKRDAILLNAAGAIAAGGHADDLREGLDAARQAVDSGAAAERLDALVAFSHG
jgi:anthranilate phosphoribosyltransferase